MVMWIDIFLVHVYLVMPQKAGELVAETLVYFAFSFFLRFG